MRIFDKNKKPIINLYYSPLVMASQSKILKVFSVLLALVMMTNCTVYNAVRQSPDAINPDKHIVLHKDGLVFQLGSPSIAGDTIYARLTDRLYDPMKHSRADIYLKPGLELQQDSLGILIIPFSYVDHIDNYVKDKYKTKRNFLIGIGGAVVLGVIVFVAVLADALNDPIDWPDGHI